MWNFLYLSGLNAGDANREVALARTRLSGSGFRMPRRVPNNVEINGVSAGFRLLVCELVSQRTEEI